jgi:hypothetical protein
MGHVDLAGDGTHLADAGQVAEDRSVGLRDRRQRRIGTSPVAPVHHNLMAHVGQQLCSHQAKACRSAGDKDLPDYA